MRVFTPGRGGIPMNRLVSAEWNVHPEQRYRRYDSAEFRNDKENMTAGLRACFVSLRFSPACVTVGSEPVVLGDELVVFGVLQHGFEQ